MAERCVRAFDHRDNLRARSLTLLPHPQRFLYRIFFAIEPTRFQCQTKKRPLVCRELNIHAFKRRSQAGGCQ